MNLINKWTGIALATLVLSSCDHPVKTSTTVYEDGSLDKSIRFKKTEENKSFSNYFGISSEQGWTSWDEDQKAGTDSTSKSDKFIELSKHFQSSLEANRILDNNVDTLFQIHSDFKKSFRWFYTYLTYTDTYRAINRFRYVSPSEYLTQEDFAFIDRLPAEGQPLHRVDSIYLENLGIKIYEDYLSAVLFEEQLELLKTLLKESNLHKSWLDTLEAKRDYLYQMILDDGELPELEAKSFIDSLGIPLDDSSNDRYDELYRELESRVNFMSWANDGKYEHTISIPWELMETNADSIAGNILIWKPPTSKFMFKDYTMYAESRRLNVWALVVSAVLILITLVSFIVRKSRKPI